MKSAILKTFRKWMGNSIPIFRNWFFILSYLMWDLFWLPLSHLIAYCKVLLIPEFLFPQGLN